MVGKSKLIYIVGCAIIGVVALLIVILSFVAGGLTIASAQTIVISSASEQFTYDGTAHTNDVWTMEQGSLKKGHTAQVTVSGSRTEVGTSENYVTAIIVDENGADVTDNYTIEYLTGQITVNPRTITISTSSAKKEYDGTPLTANEQSDHIITDGTLLDGEEITFINNTSITDAGIVYNTFSRVYVKDAKGRDKSNNYEFICEAGTLEITARKISIEAQSEMHEYDGKPFSCNKLKGVTSESNLLEGHEITAWDIPAQATDVGVWENYIAAVTISDTEDKDVTNNYELDFHSGQLMITPRRIAVRSGTTTQKYTGETFTCETYDIPSSIKLADGHNPEVIISGEQTEVGSSPNYIAEVIITDADGKDVTANYEITQVLGKITVIADGQSPDGGGLDNSGNIGGGDSNAPERLALRVWSEFSGKVYLKNKSFGVYNMRSWNEAQPYAHLLDGKYGADYLTGIALKNAGYTSNEIIVDVSNQYFLPYYMEKSQSDYAVQSSDVFYSGDGKTHYSLYYYSYDYVTDGELNSDLGEYSAYERQYREYVKNNYLSYPQSTKNALSAILSQFDTSDSDIIEKVAKYVQTAAEYDLKYDTEKLDKSDDIVVTFLTDYKKGICQHYASSATLIYRMLGIPARYAIGYVGDTQEGEWTDITNKDAHAWVEVYIDGMGWAVVEVTGADSNGGGGDGDEQDKKEGTTIRPVTEYYPYDGVTAYTHSTKLRGVTALERAGYTYKYTIANAQRIEEGKTEIKITSFRLFDPNGNDVTDTVPFKLGTGYLCVYRWSLDIVTQSEQKEYDGKPFVPTTQPEITLGQSLNHKVQYTPKASITEVGVVENSYDITVTDENGQDVTDMYKINTHYGKLTVTHRKITVTADSAEKPFDGAPLTTSGFEITKGELAEGHKISATVTGSQIKLGESANKITSVQIFDESGNDVSSNYAVTMVNGLLLVTPPV
ncbi:MAG: transglutaminase-like domain-containing protein [Clostridia bacterium]|nr:transglutaminase-like domain-containing protein [Clostridia bacterium]